MAISIILTRPQNPGNIGAVARVMTNFDFERLYLLDPKTSHLSREALDRATHAKPILKKAKILKLLELKKFDYLIGTTARLGTDYNIPRSPISPEQLSVLLKDKKAQIGLLFGPEGDGLTNEEIQNCDFIVTIKTSKKFPSMNLSHAVAIVLYEISKNMNNKKIGSFPTTKKKTKDKLMELIYKKIDAMDFKTIEKRQTQKIIWKRILGKSFLTEREVFALFGFFKKL